MRLSKAILVFVIVCAVTAACLCPIFASETCELTFEAVAAESIDFEKEAVCNASSAILINADSRSVLYSKNDNFRRGMASTTKIMTALIAIESTHPDQEYEIPEEAVGIEGSSVYLLEGEVLTMRELLYCLMLESGNDAATAIAIICAGSVDAFAEIMNERAVEMGLENTHFTNPHGLSDENHYTTAYDLAMITAEAMEYPLFREIVSTKTKRVAYDSVDEGRHLVNHNKLLFGYEGAIGVKTGYTMRDGKCLVSAAERNGMTVIAVTLQDPSPTSTHRAMLDRAFDEYESKQILSSGEISISLPVENGVTEFVTVTSPNDVYMCLPKGEKTEIRIVKPDRVSAPIENGVILARAEVLCRGRVVYIINLESSEPVEEKRLTLFEKIFGE